tara:strand:- start:502 stop:918 length:417 start_codon:yes stop_codon:yes gene_type:complete
MEYSMEDDKSDWSNVVIGPWTSKEPPKKGGKTRDQIIAEEMSIVDSLSEKVMVQLIQTLKDNEVSISTKDFYRYIGFMNETLKAMLFKELGYEHPLSDFVQYIIVPVKTNDKKDIYTKFRADLVAELVEYLEGPYEEE